MYAVSKAGTLPTEDLSTAMAYQRCNPGAAPTALTHPWRHLHCTRTSSLVSLRGSVCGSELNNKAKFRAHSSVMHCGRRTLLLLIGAIRHVTALL
ncbi:hypothetical protein Zmor_026018 [Zophobas morio]|uniref:Uncharacterized protein n=1 Tax=Zophobas morio TaxID=2755281 RepID=A0AA38M4N9_9CUCU|nr:hypothetical protein Zmor_026018 [Zophobas morio]